MLLVIPSDVIDAALVRVRIVQENCLQSHDKVSASLLEKVINDLNRESIDVQQSIVRGRKEIMEMM